MKFRHIIYSVLLGTLLSACSNENEEDLEARALAEIPESNSITFEANVRAIMQDNCNMCHTSPTAFGAPFPLLTFDDVSSRADRIITRMNSEENPMPPSGRVSLEIRNTIEQWRENGLLEE